MRFDSDEHLERWRGTGRFPAIHDAVAKMVVEETRSTRWCDLCSSTGLLGARLRTRHRMFVVGIEGDADAVGRGIRAGVRLDGVLVTRIDFDHLDEVRMHLEAHRVQGIVARRCLPELFEVPGNRAALPRLFAEAGVQELVVEGRVASGRATSAFPSIVQEVEALAPFYVEARRVGAVSYLRRG